MISHPAVIPDWLAAAARAVPQRTALVADSRSWTFAQLDADVSRMAAAILARGARPGDRVAALLPNCAALAMLPHAALRAGVALVPLNTRLSRHELEWQLSHAAPALVIRDESLLTSDAPAERPALLAERAASDVLAVIYTSGTTSRPKGAMLTVGNFWWSARASAANLGVRDDDRWLAVLPLFHVGGLSIILRSAIGATCAVVHPRFDADAVNRAIDADGVTLISAVSVMLERLLDARGGRPFPATLRCALVGGGPVPPTLLDRCARAGLTVAQTYGLTEAASQVTTLAPGDALRKAGSAGRPLDGMEVRIASEPEGEILVRGPTVMAGYLNDPAAAALAVRDGWLHTGDVGRLDSEGFLYVLDRRDDLIVTGGENVSPAEVEAALEEHSAVEECAVVGVPDATWGQRVVAVVRAGGIAGPGVADELLRHCRERLAGYKVPREVRFVSEPLPRTASGKLRRSALRESS